MNTAWGWVTVLAAVAGLGCLLLTVMLVGTLGALFISLAWTLARAR